VTDGNLEFVQILASWAVIAPTVFAVILRDEKKLDGPARERAWPPVSRDAAVLAMWLLGFAPIMLLAFFLVHFGRTRGVSGLWLGFGWALATTAASVLAQLAAAAVVDISGA
jgi:hypothetical protein